jgi:very-short-patch-repair endonuclease
MLKRMLKYNSNLKHSARYLRENMTESEQALWSRLRGKQLLGVQFYRQKPVGNFIVDFFAPKGKLVVEVDGSQHAEDYHAVKDIERDNLLSSLGIRVLRFNSREVLKDTDAVIELIFRAIEGRLEEKSPQPPFVKGG